MKQFKSLARSFKYAASGILKTIRSERNMRIHITVAALIIAFLPFYELSPAEIGLLALTIGSVMSAELFNTAIERAVDLTTTEKKPLAEFSKDAAAGAVLVTAISSVIVGIALFYKPDVFREIISFSKERLWFPALIALMLVSGLIFVFSNFKQDKE